MNKTGAKHGRFYPPVGDIRRGMSLSAARSDGHTPRKLPRSREQSPTSSQRTLDRRSFIVQQVPPGSQAVFCPFPKVFSRFWAVPAKSICATSRRSAPAVRRGRLWERINTPRPSKPSSWRACRSRRTRRSNAPAQRGCTGRTRRPPPSCASRRPARRTTWFWRSRPESPSSP